MAHLPTPGKDAGTWGTILNEFLEVSLNQNGTLKPSALQKAGGVTTVNGKAPVNWGGAVTLTASDVSAVATSSVGAQGGVASLGSNTLVPTDQLGTGSADSSTYLRGDGTWITPNGGSSSLSSDSDVTITSPTNNQVLTYNSTANKWENMNAQVPGNATSSTLGLIQLDGDLGNTATSPEVISTHLSSPLPTNQGGTGSVTQNFVDLTTNQTISGNKTLTGTTTVDDLDATAVSAASLQVNGGSPATGKVLTSDSSGNASWETPASAPVSSVFGRTGAVVAQTGDYTASQVGALSSTDDLSAIATANLTANDVSLNSHKITNLENGTSASDAAAFGQIPTALPPNGSAGGDLSGTYPSPTVAKINGITLPSSAPSGSGLVLTSTSSSATSWEAASTDATSVDGVTVTGTPSSGQVITATSGTAANWQTPVSDGDATSSAPGLIQLDGDLGNTATSPEVVSTHLSSPLPIAQGGTGSGTQNFVDLSSNQTIAGNKTFSGTTTFSAETIVPTPVNPTDAATKAYVDSTAQGLDPKQSVAAATTTALPTNTYNNGSSGVGATLTATANGALSIDGYSTGTNDRVLIQNESSSADNGIYVVSNAGSAGVPYVLTRSTDFDTSSQVPGAYIFAEQGTTNAGSGFVCTTTGTVTFGTTSIAWTQFSGAGEVSAGTGLTKSGNTLSLTIPVPIASGGTGQTTQTFVNLAGDLGNTVTVPRVESIQGVAISGTPSANQTLVATSSSAASWSTPSNAPVTSVDGMTGAITGLLQASNNLSDVSSEATAFSNIKQNATASVTGVIQLAGDLGNSATVPRVESIQGVSTPSSAPSTGQVLTATSASATSWQTPSNSTAQLSQTSLQTGNYAAAANQLVPVSTSSGNVTVTLPNAPAGGTLVGVKMVIQASTNTVSIACAGSDVFNKSGGNTTGTLSLPNQGLLMEYNSGIWLVLSDDLPLSQLDGRYLLSNGVTVTGTPSANQVLVATSPTAATWTTLDAATNEFAIAMSVALG